MTDEEIDYLKFFYKTACEYFSDGGTDEAYWITEAYREATGKEVPERFVR